jgi:hypothetical protein
LRRAWRSSNGRSGSAAAGWRDDGAVAERHDLAFAGARLAVGVGDLAVGADDLELRQAGQGDSARASVRAAREAAVG